MIIDKVKSGSSGRNGNVVMFLCVLSQTLKVREDDLKKCFTDDGWNMIEDDLWIAPPEIAKLSKPFAFTSSS